MARDADRAARRRVVVVAGVALLIAAAWSAWWQRPPAAGRIAPAGAIETNTTSPAPAPAAMPQVEAAVEREPAPAAGIAGRVVALDGAPVAGAAVRLHRRSRSIVGGAPDPLFGSSFAPPGRSLSTDSDGRFEAVPLDPGDYEVGPVGGRNESVTLAPGERCELELRLPGVLVVLHPTDEGRPAPFHHLRLDADVVAELFGEPGTVQRVVRPGRLVVDVVPHGGEHRRRPVRRYELVVPVGVARFEREIDVGAPALRVDVRWSEGRALDRFEVLVAGTSALDGREFELRQPNGQPGIAWLSPIPPGTYRVQVRGEFCRTPPAQTVAVEPPASRAHATFLVQPAGAVELELHGSGRYPPRLQLPWLPPLVSADGPVAGAALPGDPARREPRIAFGGVPPGRAELVLADWRDGDAWRTLPFDPLPPQAVDVVVGQTQRLVSTVVLRATVDLLACDRGGRIDSRAKLTVWHGDLPVASRAGGKPHHWLGELPPGDHRVTVDRGGAVREHRVRVGRTSFELRLRP